MLLLSSLVYHLVANAFETSLATWHSRVRVGIFPRGSAVMGRSLSISSTAGGSRGFRPTVAVYFTPSHHSYTVNSCSGQASSECMPCIL
ncbi:hypothetical protein BJV74DRAFT_838459 [Russula compacta]|nr:hypothetical protein BJV74DRAFT_838459 [Russula compacta]